jgi:hypothetical protein
VVGKIQVSCLERAEIGLANHDNSYMKDDAIAGIEEMERELSTHLVSLFHARFGTNRKGTGRGKMFNPLARDRTAAFSWLAEEVALATQTYGMSLRSASRPKTSNANEGPGSHIFDEREPPHHELGAMKEKNVTRLLARFMEPFT